MAGSSFFKYVCKVGSKLAVVLVLGLSLAGQAFAADVVTTVKDADGWSHVVGEHQEGSGEGADAPMEGHSVQEGSHGVLPDSEVDDSSARAFCQEVSTSLDIRLVGTCQVGRSADEVRDTTGNGLKDVPR